MWCGNCVFVCGTVPEFSVTSAVSAHAVVDNLNLQKSATVRAVNGRAKHKVIKNLNK